LAPTRELAKRILQLKKGLLGKRLYVRALILGGENLNDQVKALNISPF